MEAGRRGKKRFRKKPSEAAVSLSQEDIEFLQVARVMLSVKIMCSSSQTILYKCQANTRYSETEIREWFSGFRDVCPAGQLDRENIFDIYAMPRRNAQAAQLVTVITILTNQVILCDSKPTDQQLSCAYNYSGVWLWLSQCALCRNSLTRCSVYLTETETGVSASGSSFSPPTSPPARLSLQAPAMHSNAFNA